MNEQVLFSHILSKTKMNGVTTMTMTTTGTDTGVLRLLR